MKICYKIEHCLFQVLPLLPLPRPTFSSCWRKDQLARYKLPRHQGLRLPLLCVLWWPHWDAGQQSLPGWLSWAPPFVLSLQLHAQTSSHCTRTTLLVQTPQASTGSRDWQGAQEAAGELRMFHFLVWGWLHGHVQSTNIHGAGHLQGRHIIWRYVLFSTLHLRLKQKVKGTSRTHLCVECCGQVREASREAQFTPKWKGQRGKGAGWRPPEVRGESSDVRNSTTHEKRQRSASP